MAEEEADVTLAQLYAEQMGRIGRTVRPGQEALIELGVELEPLDRVLVNAPTATGKSLAALIIGGLRAGVGERTVIATYTRLLQNQYRDTDLVLARQLFPDVDFAVLKGAQNYLCRTAAGRIGRGWRSADYAALAAGTGDPGELGVDGLWKARADAERCRKHSPAMCGFVAAKKRAQEADVVITNHALVLINGLQPAVLGMHSLLIVDEIHNFPRAAESFCSEELDLDQLVADLYQLVGGAARDGAEALLRTVKPGEAERLATTAELLEVITAYKMLPRGLDSPLLKLLHRWITTAVRRQRTGRIGDDVATIGPEPKRRLLLTSVDLRGICSRALATCLSLTDEDGREVGEDSEFDRAVLMMSATTGTPERPLWVAERCGVEGSTDYGRGTRLVKVPSPLDYPGSLRVSVVGENRPWPELAEELIREVGGRTLVLMRSWWRVDQMEAHLSSCGLGVPVLVQNRKDPVENSSLVARFREDERSVLVGTASFFEGIDVPGPALSQIIIGELPVPLVWSPVALERRKRAGLGWVQDVQVPQTAVVLEQMIGRLVRAVGDRGLVAILDASAERGSGKAALRSALDTFGGAGVLVPRSAALTWFLGPC